MAPKYDLLGVVPQGEGGEELVRSRQYYML